MSDTYTIRLASAEDLPLLPAIEHEAASRFALYGLDTVMATVVSDAAQFQSAYYAGRLWVAADAQNHPVGFALANVIRGHAHLDELDVLPAHGRRGLGAALVQAVHQWAVQQGFSAITLTTMAQIPWNRPFYERLGYHVVAPDALSEALRALLSAEAAHGLPPKGRVVMSCTLPPLRP